MPRKKKKKLCKSERLHQFQIIKGSGLKTGVSTWKCLHCDARKKSN